MKIKNLLFVLTQIFIYILWPIIFIISLIIIPKIVILLESLSGLRLDLILRKENIW